MRLDLVNDRRGICAAAVALVAAFAACSDQATAPDAPFVGSTNAAAKVDGGPLPTRYVLPGSSVFPEGIAYDERTQLVFVSSTTDGTIFRGSVTTKSLAR